LVPYIYSKSNYKLFLHRELAELSKEVKAIVCAMDIFPNIIRPIPIKAPFGKSALVIAPHQDDEIIGCGGAMVLHRKTGNDLHVVFIQDGGDEHEEDGLSRDELIHIRETEALKVSGELGIPAPIFLRHPKLIDNIIKEIAISLEEIILTNKIDVIFAPFFFDYNKDHRVTAVALAEAISNMQQKPKILNYEVWGLCIPNVVVNIDSVIENKIRLLSYYVSQLSGTDYINCTIGLNMYHSKTFGAGECKYAERFFEIPGEDYVQVIDKIRFNQG